MHQSERSLAEAQEVHDAVWLSAASAEWLGASEDGAMLWFGGEEPVAAAHLRGVLGDDVHQGPEAELLLSEASRYAQRRDLELRVHEELAGVIARLLVDVDGRREVWGCALVDPVRVVEPRVSFAERDEVASASVVEAELAARGAGM